MHAVPSPRHPGVLVGLLAAAVAGVVIVTLAEPGTTSGAVARDLAATVSFVAAASAISIGGRSWPGARSVAIGFALLGGMSALSAVVPSQVVVPHVSDVLLLGLLVPFVYAARDEFRAHFDETDRREVTADAVLLTLAVAAIAYVWLRPIDGSDAAIAAAASFSLFGAAIIAVFGALTLCVPTTGHVLRFIAAAALGAATLGLGAAWASGTADTAPMWIWWTFAIAPPAVGAVFVAMRHDDRAVSVLASAGLARPALTSITIVASAVALSIVAILDDAHGIAGVEATAILLILAIGIASRILANQQATADAFARAEEALTQQRAALVETDAALERVRETNESLRRSEEHLRLIFDAAVDGFVEVDHAGSVIRANGAFGRMVSRDPAALAGRTWDEIASVVEGADPAIARLQHGGQATIARPDGQVLHLESTASVIPTNPPRTLVLVRDVSAAKVAEQTIRSLFHFLQDRDEDRTRLLRRSNAAIEQERNRIARDLHDGPVQGVSAATLSLEAALLMIKAGDADNGIQLLEKIRAELAGEADALRRLMSGLRPPVLEERGLMPALREMLARFETDCGVVSIFEGGVRRSVPRDVETLAYRVVQEALSNVRHHAKASSVTVHVDTDTGQLRVEVEDDGVGFETNLTRDYLRAGRVGLASMRERVELASGTFNMRSTPGRGTAITALIPLDAEILAVPAM
jgi:PAS domain S-box-containing protein